MANTTRKGDLFEEKVFKIVKRLMEEGGLGVNPVTAKVYRRKKYPSKDSRRGIVFDVTIESFFTEESTKYSMLYAFECKDYVKNVEVKVVRELSQKLDEVGSGNTKGLIVTTKGFQEGAREAANSRGIALGLLNNEIGIDWVVPRINKFTSFSSPNIKSAGNAYERSSGQFFWDGCAEFRTLHELFVHWGLSSDILEQQNRIPIAKSTNSDIDNLISSFSDGCYVNGVLDESRIRSVLSKHYGLSFVFGDLGKIRNQDILGQLSLVRDEVIISNIIKNDSCRRRFTLAHEIGHFFLHSKRLRKHIKDIYDFEFTLKNGIYAKDLIRLEREANKFASRLLLLESPLKTDLDGYLRRKNVARRGRLYLDNQPCNKTLVFGFLGECREKYDVSSEAIKYRLIELDLLEEHGAPTRISRFKL